jgi:hypothetical protein
MSLTQDLSASILHAAFAFLVHQRNIYAQSVVNLGGIQKHCFYGMGEAVLMQLTLIVASNVGNTSPHSNMCLTILLELENTDVIVGTMSATHAQKKLPKIALYAKPQEERLLLLLNFVNWLQKQHHVKNNPPETLFYFCYIKYQYFPC